MLLQGLTDIAAKEWKKGTHHGGQHLHQLLKFLTVRHEVDNALKGKMERSGIMAVGGAHDAALDGPMDGDPRWNACLEVGYSDRMLLGITQITAVYNL